MKKMLEGLKELESLNLVEKVNDIVKARIAKNIYSSNVTRSDVYSYADRVLKDEICTIFNIDEDCLYNRGITINTQRWGNGNNKNRFVSIRYVFDGREYTLGYIAFDVKTKKLFESKGYRVKDNFGAVAFETTHITACDFEHLTLEEAIKHAQELRKAELADMRMNQLPKFIEETEKRFAEIIEKMKNGEDIGSTWDLRRIQDNYDELRNKRWY